MEGANTSLLDLVAAEFPIGSSIGPSELRTLMADLGLPEADLGFRSTAEAGLREWAGGTEELSFNPGGWRVGISGPAAQSAVTGAILWALFAWMGVTTPIPLAVAAAVVPQLIDVKRVRLSASETEILATLTPHHKAVWGSPDELYAQLPDEVRSELSSLDFRDMLESFQAAGRVDKKATDLIRILPNSEKRLRVTFA